MERSNRTTRRLRCLIVAALVGGGLTAPLTAGSPLDDVQKAATEWAQVRAETVRIESDWAWQQSLMRSTLDVLQERVRQLEEQRSALEVKTAGARRETDDLVARRQALAAAASEAARQLQALDERLGRMRPWLPPRLSAALELPFRSLARADLPLAERMQHTTTILNRCVHFNRTVAKGEEMLVPPGGEAKLMEVVYWGLTHGYALDRAAGVAYVGAPAEQGWGWTPAPELAKAVARLIAVAADKTEPEFVAVPVQVSEPAALNPKP
jgi:hypothetical protein